MPRRSHPLAPISHDRALLRLALGWLLVFAPGLAVVTVAAQVFHLLAPSSREPLLCCPTASLRVAGGAEAVLTTHTHDGGQ